jgi:hypothetical protein
MQQQSTAEHAPSGLATLPSLAWGSHLGQLYNSADDLRDTLVPYFRAGLENNERCLWVTDAPFDVNVMRAWHDGQVEMITLPHSLQCFPASPGLVSRSSVATCPCGHTAAVL